MEDLPLNSMLTVHELTSGEAIISIDSVESHLTKQGQDEGNENTTFNSADCHFH